MCGNNFMVLKVAPPLVVTDAQLDAFVEAARDVVELAHSPGAFWSEALGLARRAVPQLDLSLARLDFFDNRVTIRLCGIGTIH